MLVPGKDPAVPAGCVLQAHPNTFPEPLGKDVGLTGFRHVSNCCANISLPQISSGTSVATQDERQMSQNCFRVQSGREQQQNGETVPPGGQVNLVFDVRIATFYHLKIPVFKQRIMRNANKQELWPILRKKM